MPRLILLVLALSFGVAHADDAQTQAEARWKQGKAFYDSGQWDHAIAEFRAAFALVKEPDLLFGIALAMEKKGDLEGAREHARRYLGLAPTGSLANEAREMVATLTPKIEALAADAAKRKRDDDAKREQDLKRAEDDQRREQLIAAAQRRARTLRWTGLGLAAAGGVFVGLGTKFGLDAHGASKDLEAHTSGAWTDELLARQAEGRSANHKFIACTLIGGALVVGGGVTFAFGLRTQTEVVVADGGASLSFVGRF